MSTDPQPRSTVPTAPRVRVELLCHADCPHAERTRVLLRECLAEAGLDAPVIEWVGAHPSPTVLVDGRDVMGPAGPPSGIATCRLDIPTGERVRAALRQASRARPD